MEILNFHIKKLANKKLGNQKWGWIIFAINRKPNDFFSSIANVVGEYNSVIVVDTLISAWRKPCQWPLHVRAIPINNISHGIVYKIWHTPERIIGTTFLRRLNARRISRDLDRLLPCENRVVIYDSPTYYHLVGALRECLSVYIAVDDLTVTVTGERIPGELEAERQLLGKVGLVFCVSEVLAERLRERSPSNSSPPIRVLPNGYDERLFDPNRDWTEPDALGDIPKPRILVAGHISERIDWDGIIGASQLRQNWNWVFVGPTDKEMTGKIANALGKKGFYHPPIPVTEVPAWISHCDACAVPYRLNPFTRASHPLKAIEYLAMGAVVLSTRIPSLERYNGVIEWVNEGDAESYARALDELANQAGSQEIRHLRQRAVSGDSLGVRVNQFREIVINAIP